jgi:hypothetical protein
MWRWLLACQGCWRLSGMLALVRHVDCHWTGLGGTYSIVSGLFTVPGLDGETPTRVIHWTRMRDLFWVSVRWLRTTHAIGPNWDQKMTYFPKHYVFSEILRWSTRKKQSCPKCLLYLLLRALENCYTGCVYNAWTNFNGEVFTLRQIKNVYIHNICPDI